MCFTSWEDKTRPVSPTLSTVHQCVWLSEGWGRAAPESRGIPHNLGVTDPVCRCPGPAACLEPRFPRRGQEAPPPAWESLQLLGLQDFPATPPGDVEGLGQAVNGAGSAWEGWGRPRGNRKQQTEGCNSENKLCLAAGSWQAAGGRQRSVAVAWQGWAGPHATWEGGGLACGTHPISPTYARPGKGQH